MYMRRKQVYIDEDQERLLKQRSQELGVSEAELIRRGLDRVLGDETINPRVSERRKKAVQDLLTHAEELANTLGPGLSKDWSREDLYREREDRWIKKLQD